MSAACAYWPSPVGLLGLRAQEGRLLQVFFAEEQEKECHGPAGSSCADELLAKAVQALEGYFSCPGGGFSLPLAPAASPFGARLRQALLSIPAGTTRTYGELALQVGTHPRALGQALARNPFPIIIPCHRVVGKHDLGGYLGKRDGGKSIKPLLLAHEKRLCA